MKKLIFVVFVVMATLAATAQEGRHRQFNPEEFRVRLENTLKQEACLNEQEAAAFFPIYYELHEKSRKLGHEAEQLKRNAATQDEQAAQRTVNRLMEIKVEIARLEKEYTDRMCKAIPAAKVLRVKLAEDKFHRDMLKRMGERRGQNRQHKE